MGPPLNWFIKVIENLQLGVGSESELQTDRIPKFFTSSFIVEYVFIEIIGDYFEIFHFCYTANVTVKLEIEIKRKFR